MSEDKRVIEATPGPTEEPVLTPRPGPVVSARSKRLRVYLGVIGFLVALVILGVLYFFYLRSSHLSPLTFEVYANATQVSESKGSQSDSQTYKTTDSVTQVLAFYTKIYGETKHYLLDNGQVDDLHATDNGCVKVYTDSTPSGEPGHFLGRCLYEDPFGDLTRNITITITYQQNQDKSTQTNIEYDRSWGE